MNTIAGPMDTQEELGTPVQIETQKEKVFKMVQLLLIEWVAAKEYRKMVKGD